MCFSALIQKIEEGTSLVLDNYANFLSLFPPTQMVRIKLGEKNLGSSWSCYHGVSRWYKDCGCNTGNQEGWNQKWRKPLRDSFDYLDKQIDSIYQKQISKLAKGSPNKIFNDYINVLTKKISHQDFALQYGVLDAKSLTKFFKLLEAKKYAMYMYTSCGWFFSELSGLEPTQNICYGLCALELIKDVSEKNISTTIAQKFLNQLDEAKCNISEKGSGKDLANAILRWCRQTPFHVACNQIADTIANSDSLTGTTKTKNPPINITIALNKKVGNYYFSKIIAVPPYDRLHGSIKFENFNIQEEYTIDFDIETNENQEIFFTLKNSRQKTKMTFPVKEVGVSPIVQQTMLLKLFDSWSKDDHLFNTILLLLDGISYSNQEFTARQKDFYNSVLNLRLGKILNEVIENPISLDKHLKYIKIIIASLCKNGDCVDPVVSNLLSRLIYNQIVIFADKEFEIANGKEILYLLELIYKHKINCDLTNSQGFAYNLLIRELKKRSKTSEEESIIIKNNVVTVEQLCDYLNLNTAHIRYEESNKNESR